MITTKTGDAGMTSLSGGRRVPKDDARIELNGQLDELNALMGLCKALSGREDPYAAIQHELMMLMGMVAGYAVKPPAQLGASAEGQTAEEHLVASVAAMESEIERICGQGKFAFVLPGKNQLDAVLHMARAKTRTCERRWVALRAMQQSGEPSAHDEAEPLPQVTGVYLNRLSDYLFALSLEVK